MLELLVVGCNGAQCTEANATTFEIRSRPVTSTLAIGNYQATSNQFARRK